MGECGVDLLHLRLSGCSPLYERCLHSYLDEAVVGYLVNGFRNYRVEDGHVPRPDLVQLVAISVCGGSLDDSRFESCHVQVGVHPTEHPVHVSSHDDFGCGVLSHYVLYQLNHFISLLHHELLVARFQVHIKDVDFPSPRRTLFGPVQISA